MIIEQIYKLSNLIYERKFLQMKETMTKKPQNHIEAQLEKAKWWEPGKTKPVVDGEGGMGSDGEGNGEKF